jgi:dipeptidyl aminopeptidase/acylaminoacyl peptidase
VINPQDGKARQVTRLGLASMRPEHLPATQIVNFASDDGTIISGVLWMPFNLPRDGRAPAVVMPHGGPTWQTKDRFDAMALALATRGYLVLAPNARGSTGYGRAFREGNHMDLGGGDLADQVAAAKFMVESGFVDAGKIGITGGSYGGYLTLMAMGRTPGIWAAGVAEYGIVNWYSMWQNGSPQLRFYQKSLIGDPVKDKATYDAASPMTYLRATRAPLLVLQGDNDLRVPKEQAVEVVNILKAAGKTVDAHYYPGEGHGFQKRENQIDALERAITWFDTYLKDKP